MVDRCPTCDREECDRDEAQIVRVVCNCPTIWCEHWQRLRDARAACTANTVNWRERAMVAEALLKSREGLLTASEGRRLLAADDWVPVTERLPEESAVVLAFDSGRIVEGWTYIDCDGDVRWCGRGSDLYSVTHWRQLPAPPEPQAVQEVSR